MNKKTNEIINVVICIILFLIPILITPREISSIPYNTLKIIALLLCGLILFICVLSKRKSLKLVLIDKTLLAFYILIIISTIFSVNIKKAIIGEHNRYEGFLSFTTYFLTYYCAKYYFSYNRKLKNFMIITVAICSIIGILQYYNIFPLYYIFNIPYTPHFASSTFGNRNFFGSFLSIVVPLFIALYLIKRKKIYLIVSYISFWAILTGMTRSSWIGIVIASIFGIIYIIKNSNIEIIKCTTHIIIGFTAIFIFVLIAPKIFNSSIFSQQDTLFARLNSMKQDLNVALNGDNINDTNSIGSGRIRIWILCLKETAMNPLIGTGPDTLIDGTLKNLPYDTINFVNETNTFADKAHNEYLQIAATIGIPALVVYLAFLVQILVNQKDMFKNYSTFVLVIPIISYLVQAFFNISTIGVAPIVWFLLGAIQNNKFKEDLCMDLKEQK